MGMQPAQQLDAHPQPFPQPSLQAHTELTPSKNHVDDSQPGLVDTTPDVIQHKQQQSTVSEDDNDADEEHPALLYGDIDTTSSLRLECHQLRHQLTQLQQHHAVLQTKYTEQHTQLTQCQSVRDKYQQQCVVFARNISVLYATAVSEIQRKNAEIDRLKEYMEQHRRQQRQKINTDNSTGGVMYKTTTVPTIIINHPTATTTTTTTTTTTAAILSSSPTYSLLPVSSLLSASSVPSATSAHKRKLDNEPRYNGARPPYVHHSSSLRSVSIESLTVSSASQSDQKRARVHNRKEEGEL